MSGADMDAAIHLTEDPTVHLLGHPVPAMTTLLYRVCGNDQDKFDEALRLINLFMAKAVELSTKGKR